MVVFENTMQPDFRPEENEDDENSTSNEGNVSEESGENPGEQMRRAEIGAISMAGGELGFKNSVVGKSASGLRSPDQNTMVPNSRPLRKTFSFGAFPSMTRRGTKNSNSMNNPNSPNATNGASVGNGPNNMNSRSIMNRPSVNNGARIINGSNINNKPNIINNSNFNNGARTQGQDSKPKLDPKKFQLKKYMPAMVIGVVLLFVVGFIVVFAVPMMMISTIDYNLQRSLGFDSTVGILEKQATHVVSELAGNGEMPDNFANALAEKGGINFGQVTANGDFVRTNKYLASLDGVEVAALDTVELSKLGGAEIAYLGSGFEKTDDGKLAILFDGELIAAKDFPEAVAENSKLLVAFSESADISGRFYYSEAVDEVYDEMKISRGNFNSWQSSGNSSNDATSFNAIITKMLNANPTIQTNGYNKAPFTGSTKPSGDYSRTFSSADGDATEIISNMVEVMRDNDPDMSQYDLTGQVAQLLSLAVTSAEPYLAANSFMAIEEPIQRARIDGDGPVNELMSLISQNHEVEFIDIATSSTKKENVSILNTRNFEAATSGSQYDYNEALNFSRDRVLLTTGTDNSRISNPNLTAPEDNSTHQPAQASSGQPKSNMTERFYCKLTFRVHPGEELPRWDTMDEAGCRRASDIVYNARSAISEVLTDKNSEIFTSVVGGNRIVEGGSYISNFINLRTLGAMPSEADAVAKYQTEVTDILARKDAAEAEVKSPFDITSPNTFFGRLVHNLGAAVIQSSGGLGGGSLLNTTATVSGLAANATNRLLQTAQADGPARFDEIVSDGANCPTINEARNVAGDLYCNAHNTVNTDHMDYSLNDWKSALAGNIDNEGQVVDKSDLAQFVAIGMHRDTTVGMDSGEVCERWKEFDNISLFDKLIDSIKRFISEKVLNNMVDLYDSCEAVYKQHFRAKEESQYIPSGIAYTFGSGNTSGIQEDVEKFSGYALYSTVRGLIEEKTSVTTAYARKYFAEHPLDNSDSGFLARISGMSKSEAEMVLGYVDYLNMIANYNPGEAYAFSKESQLVLNFAGRPWFNNSVHDHEDMVAVLALVLGKNSYRKIRSFGITA